jgi:hypothetical protein
VRPRIGFPLGVPDDFPLRYDIHVAFPAQCGLHHRHTLAGVYHWGSALGREVVFPVVDFFAHELHKRCTLRIVLADGTMKWTAVAFTDRQVASSRRAALVRIMAGGAADIAIVQVLGEVAQGIQVIRRHTPRMRT